MEDTYSENSGETGASDSGRGGSEEDVQLHRNPYQNVKTGKEHTRETLVFVSLDNETNIL